LERGAMGSVSFQNLENYRDEQGNIRKPVKLHDILAFHSYYFEIFSYKWRFT
jgi:hypothetical protein